MVVGVMLIGSREIKSHGIKSSVVWMGKWKRMSEDGKVCGFETSKHREWYREEHYLQDAATWKKSRMRTLSSILARIPDGRKPKRDCPSVDMNIQYKLNQVKLQARKPKQFT